MSSEVLFPLLVALAIGALCIAFIIHTSTDTQNEHTDDTDR
jgi:hypothetical protein